MYDNDIALVKRLLRGDQASFTAFYNMYFPRIFRFCRLRIKNTEDCQDIVQQTMTNAMKSLASYRGEASLQTWLCQIGRNEMSAWYKKTGKKLELNDSMDKTPGLLAAIESRPSSITGQSVHASNDILTELVQTSLDNLPTSYGRVLEMKYVDGFSVNEIAAQMQMGEVAVQSLLARARTAFKTLFTDLEIEYTSM